MAGTISIPEPSLSSSEVPTTGSGNYQPQVVNPLIAQAATKWNVPQAILQGVFGIESAFGADSKTSSAGAIGPFQFLPPTAAQYKYPLTNTPTIGQFQQQADSTAHYLSDLFHQTGSWDTALRHYSGGGYGLAQVQQKAKAPVNSSEGPLASLPSLSQLNPIPDIGSIFNQAVKDAKYAGVLIAALVVAIVLVTHGVRGSGGGEGRKAVPIPV